MILCRQDCLIWLPLACLKTINSFVNELVNYGSASCDTQWQCSAAQPKHRDQGKKVNFNGNFHKQPHSVPKHTCQFENREISHLENRLTKQRIRDNRLAHRFNLKVVMGSVSKYWAWPFLFPVIERSKVDVIAFRGWNLPSDERLVACVAILTMTMSRSWWPYTLTPDQPFHPPGTRSFYLLNLRMKCF